MTEQQENPVHDREICGGPAKCPYCTPPRDVLGTIKAIRMETGNIPTIADKLSVTSKASLAALIAGSDPAYLVVTPREPPRLFLEDDFRDNFSFVDGEDPEGFAEVVIK